MPFDLETDIAQRLGTSRDAISPVLRQVIDRVQQQMAHYGYARISGLGAFRQREDMIEFEPDPVLAETVNIQFTGLDEILLPSSTEPDVSESTIADHQKDDKADVAPVIEDVESPAWSEGLDDDEANFPREPTDAEVQAREGENERTDAQSEPADVELGAADVEHEATDFDRESTEVESTDIEREATDFDYDTTAFEEVELRSDEASRDLAGASEQFDDRDETPPAVTWQPIEQASSDRPAGEQVERDDFETSPEWSHGSELLAGSEAGPSDSDDEEGGFADELASNPGEGPTTPEDEDYGESLAVPVTSASLAPDRQSRPHEWHRQQSRTKRAAAGAADEGARGGQRSYIWIAFALIVVAAAAIAFFLLVPFEQDGSAVTEQTQPPAAVEDTREAPAGTAGAAGEAASPAAGDGTPTDPPPAESWEPLRSTDEIELTRDGYTIVVWSEVSRAQAAVEARRYSDQGFRTGVLEPQDDASNRLRVGVGQFDTVEEAAAARDSLAGTAIPNDAWVLRIP